MLPVFVNTVSPKVNRAPSPVQTPSPKIMFFKVPKVSPTPSPITTPKSKEDEDFDNFMFEIQNKN